MARPLRIPYPGAVYHVMNRGASRKRIFADDTDYFDREPLSSLSSDARRQSGSGHAARQRGVYATR